MNALLRAAAGLAIGVSALLAAPMALHAAEACPPQPAPLTSDDVAQGMRDAVDRGLLWRVSKGGRTSWLYGTLHIARKAWMFPGPQVRQAMQASDRVALELDLLDPAITGRMVGLITADPSATPLPEPLARRLRAQAEAICAGPELAGLKPEMQAVTITVMSGRRAGLEPGYAIDGFLAGFARGLNKPVLSLETPESQIGLLLQATPADTASFVDRALDEIEQGQSLKTLERLAEAWARADWNELSHYADWCRCLDTEEDRALMRRLVDERNVAMADQLQKRHEAGERLFVAVGALHMIGPEGLPALLAARGFTVERM